jgi:ribosome biogenesis GTPase / thiamine phosphate phosphatase
LDINTLQPDTHLSLDRHAEKHQVAGEEIVGVVYQKNIGSAVVRANEQAIQCSLSNRLRKQLVYAQSDGGSGHRSVRQVKELAHTDPVAIGDQVRFIPTGDETGMIVEVLPRRNQITRRSAVPMPGAHPFEQVIVANLDQVVPVFAAAQPAPKWGLLDRYLVSAEASRLSALVCITKLDLATGRKGDLDSELLAAIEAYRKIGYQVILTSVVSGEGLDELRLALRGRVSALLGKSGVGKTSLLNALQPGLGLRVNQVNQRTGKGKHTTTSLQMFPISEEAASGAIVDTPGIREFGLWDVDEADLAEYFPEMRSLVGRCRFGLDCRHNEEPGCAIRQAVTTGEVSPYRYRSLRVLMEEVS